MDMHLTGRFHEPRRRRERCGLVSRVVPTKKLMEEAMAAATKIAEKSMLFHAWRVEGGGESRSYDARRCARACCSSGGLFHSLFATEDQKGGHGGPSSKSASRSSATSDRPESGAERSVPCVGHLGGGNQLRWPRGEVTAG